MTIYYTFSWSGIRGDSHVLLRDAISKYTGDRERAMALADELKIGENGKPYIEGFDHFSISHSEKAWAVLFNETECGLDIQYERKANILSIARRWYNPIDGKGVEAAMKEGEAKGRKEFFRLWARREALIKALGGSVADTVTPAVIEDAVSVGGRKYIIKDIVLSGDEELHAAICIRKEKYEDSDGGSFSVSCEPDAYSL